LPSIHKPPEREAARPSALLFAALGDPNRLYLLSRLSREGPLSISRLTAGARITRQAVTKHLRYMEKAGLVGSRRRGRERIWQLRQNRLEEARRWILLISEQWEQALERLRVFVES
jgi:DNA-binding transcriptional ArsR family regulator